RGGPVPGRLGASAATARPVARWPGRALRGRRPEPDDLLLHRCLAGASAQLPPAIPERPDRQAGPGLPVDSAGGPPGEPAAGPADRLGAGRAPADRPASTRPGTQADQP